MKPARKAVPASARDIIKAYKNLQEYLDKQPIGYPATESGIELKVLKHLFNPEEADLACKLKFIPEKVKNKHVAKAI